MNPKIVNSIHELSESPHWARLAVSAILYAEYKRLQLKPTSDLAIAINRSISLLTTISETPKDSLCMCGARAIYLDHEHCGECGGLHEGEMKHCEACYGSYPIDKMFGCEDVYLCRNCVPLEVKYADNCSS